MSYTDNLEISAQKELRDRIDNLPLSLTVRDVSEFLGICQTSAYKLVAQDGFPKVSLPGVRRVVIPKIKFLEWYLSNET